MDKPRHRILSSNPTKRYIADPGAMGLYAFAVITFCSAAMHCKWFTTLDAVMFAPAIVYGGFAQILAGLIDLIRGEKISGSTFVAFGLFWTTEGWWSLPTNGMDNVYTTPEQIRDMKKIKGCFTLGFALIALATTGAMLRTTALQVVLLALVTVDFTGVAVVQFTENVPFEKVVGYFCLVTAILAWYIGSAFLLKDKSPISLPVFPLPGNEDEDDPAVLNQDHYASATNVSTVP